MYENLVNRLREYAEDGYLIQTNVGDALKEAAGAIEELQTIAESNMRNARTWADEAAKAVTKMEELSRLYTEERNAAVELTGELASKPQWIPVADRAPEKYGTYLVTTKRKAVMVCCYYPQAKNWNTRANVTHWMPLPEEPKEETNV